MSETLITLITTTLLIATLTMITSLTGSGTALFWVATIVFLGTLLSFSQNL